jgi:hypothetical protein
MARTKKISITNFKAISSKEIDFNGCTAIITAGNNKGKTTLLRGISDRIRGEKPELIVKQGEKEGSGTIELTTGEKFVWEFDVAGTDKLTFITKEGYKTKVTREIVSRFFPVAFDIDRFLNSPPKDQSKQLQKIVGLDFSTIDARYKLAYDDRYTKNQESERFHVKLSSMLECERVDFVDLTNLQAKKEEIRSRLNALYLSNKKTNEERRIKYQAKIDAAREEVREFNEAQKKKIDKIESAKHGFNLLLEVGYLGNEVSAFIEKLPQPEPSRTFDVNTIEKPEYIVPELPNDSELRAIDDEILAASETNTKAKAYRDYVDYKAQVDAAREEALQADELVKEIENERRKMIESVKMPTGIAFEDSGITVDGFPLDKNQISTSKLYCAALRIASMNIGEVRTIHFDASFLDKNTLAEIETWAQENDLQLLIERADYEGGEIEYELIES